MSEENLVPALDLKAEQVAPAEELKETEGEATSSTQDSATVDYAAELQRAQEELEKVQRDKDNYHRAMVKAQKALKKERGQEDPSPAPEPSENPDLKSELLSAVREELGVFKKDLTGNYLEEALESVTGNPDERKLIMHHYENTLNKSGFTRSAIQKDLRLAKLLANQSRFQQENEELKASLVAKSTLDQTAQTGGQGIQQDEGPTLSAAEAAFLQRYGASAKDIK